MLKPCGNYAAVLLHKNASVICQRTCIVGVKTWIIKKHWYAPFYICWFRCPQYIQDASWFCSKSISVLSRPSDGIIQVDELDVIGIHAVLKLCSHDIHQLDHTSFSGKFSSLVRLSTIPIRAESAILKWDRWNIQVHFHEHTQLVDVELYQLTQLY